jgi:gluconolactonase
MRARAGISRRDLLAASMAAGALSLGSRRSRAAAEPGPRRIERFAPELDDIISTDAPIRDVGSGTGGPGGPTEGPVWFKEGGYLLFSDIYNDRRMKYTPGQGVTVFKEKVSRANGMTRDLQGRLVAAERDTRRVIREEPDGSVTVVANSFHGMRLNIPNDVVVKSDGAIYFTDPKRSSAPEPWDVPKAGVYRVSPDLGTVTLLVDDLIFPNGLAFSPDESVLYINDWLRGHIRAFKVASNGTLALETDHVLVDLRGEEPGAPDGMKVDSADNVYCGGSGGLYIVAPSGKKLGRIVHGYPDTTNIAFGGDDWKTLYFTTHDHLSAVSLKVAGVPVPVPPRKRS